MVHLNSKCAMEKIIVISALVFIICATVLSLPPPAGFIVYPIYNTTNHTNNSYNQPPGQQNGACMYQNIPEPGTHSIYLGCINYSDRLLYSQVSIVFCKVDKNTILELCRIITLLCTY